jgi:leader peptidase (prepilin peptidase)/N-methyltransferase
MNCGYQLTIKDLVPLLSYIFLKGRCRNCKAKLSIQYPFIETLNGVLYLVIFLIIGFNYLSIIYCLLASALLTLSVIDLKTYEIPFGINVFILALGVVRLAFEWPDYLPYVIGFFAVSVFLEIILLLSKGRAIGGGDVKLMAVCGLLIGYKLAILAFILACILGSIIHLLRMKFTDAENVLAMGPYLSLGVFISVLFGNEMINWYIGLIW